MSRQLASEARFCREVHNTLGSIYKNQGNLDEAVASYRNSLRLQPEYVEAYNNLGVVLADRGNSTRQ